MKEERMSNFRIYTWVFRIEVQSLRRILLFEINFFVAEFNEILEFFCNLINLIIKDDIVNEI